MQASHATAPRLAWALVCAVAAVVAVVALDARPAAAVSPGTPATDATWSVLVTDTASGLVRCSGEVVDRHHVVTARHCVAGNDLRTITFADGRSVTSSSSVAMPGDVRCGAVDSTPTCHYESDLRVVTLADDLSQYVGAPVPLATGVDPARLGSTPVAFVGWGGAVAPVRTAEDAYHLGCGVRARGLCYGFTGFTSVVVGDSGGAWTAMVHGASVLLGTETDGVEGAYEFGPSVHAQREWLEAQLDPLPARAGSLVRDTSGALWVVGSDGFRRAVDATTPACSTLLASSPPATVDAFDLARLPVATDAAGRCGTHHTASGSRTRGSASVQRGTSAAGRPGCSSAACAYLVVEVPAGPKARHAIRCFSERGAWAAYVTSDRVSARCYFGHPGRRVWATVDGRRSGNTLVWRVR